MIGVLIAVIIKYQREMRYLNEYYDEQIDVAEVIAHDESTKFDDLPSMIYEKYMKLSSPVCVI